jgi:SulP family sulfate permease
MSKPGNMLTKYLPILVWAKKYNKGDATNDLMAAVIVTLMLVPQALAYAVLSGLPPQVGLYASMLPLIAYAIFGTSSTLAVGPVAVASLMTAAAIQPFSAIDINLGIQAAVIIACISGFILVLSGLLRLGFLANFLSHPVITGFISAASIVIATSQLSTLLGYSVRAETLIELISSIYEHIHKTDIVTLVLSIFTLLFLVFNKKYALTFWTNIGMSTFWAQTVARSAPALLVLLGTLAMKADITWLATVRTVGDISGGLPSFSMPNTDLSLWQALWIPALLITIIGYVESISVAQSLAMKRKERIDPDQELIALGMSNLAAGFTAGLPVSGGVSRSVVNMDAGAVTPAAGLITAFGMMIASVFIANWLGDLPRFILAAIIIVAVMGLFDVGVFKRTWKYSYHDFMALVITFSLTLLVNVQSGITAGVLLSIGLHLYKSSHPHTAIVGHVSGTEHFRNVERHDVNVCPKVVTLRVDESLYFANARFLEQRILEILAEKKSTKHLILMCSAINNIDGSALEILETINEQLKYLEIGFHLSEVKGPVMDNLNKSHFIDDLNGQVYLSQFKAYEDLSCFDTGSKPTNKS